MHTFEVWAPIPSAVRVDVDGRSHDMTPSPDGWWRAEVDASPDSRYAFLLHDDDTALPDPRSPRQPDGVHAPSQLHTVDRDAWTDSQWHGRQLAGASIYELHIGTFTPEGTFAAAVDKLDHLVELGIDFVEVMPVNGFNGTHNWGYDGVLWYTVHEAYGGPDGLQALVDACHARGLGVVLDVVYNHLGPSGNYLDRYGPYLAQGANTWGRSINLDGPGSDHVRRYIIDNALRWFEEFHVDALRLDAVHALVDHTATHLLEQLAVETRRLSAHLGRPLTLIAESDLNDPKLITPRSAGGYGLDAQWDDDMHHAVHAAVSGERQGYYGDFGSLACLAETMRQGWFHAGTYSTFRGRIHGRRLDTRQIPASSLVTYTCTHDQVGNRAIGDRPGAYLDSGQLAVKAALVLCSPFTPMLFMGEEWGASTPFQFFTSHPEAELARATAEGRKAEFAEHGWSTEDVPDPQDPLTFERSKLNWDERGREPHARLLECYRALLRLRRERVELTDPWLDDLTVDYDEDERWVVVHRGALRLACNLGADPVTVPVGGSPVLWWEPPKQDETASATIVPGHSFVMLDASRTVASG
ncbi:MULTISPECIES: malto-oligosyltrehalose trehalohydrolase [Rhodococcus]|uniref:Malto-oligosyltrehalose trehalohydrolase n=1 Tax=Rhodococcus oxybenzonivorans TaxID=1990687 RepID=A0AAE5A4P8_9NOCA|nr:MULTISPECIES: malto-oligosyltrehalose trehalohydrolase [Rhodococcus]MDV7244141.1 malto-oligosyltrehalose trehalohydrolase [Rhodococcus oxybenzonivorans]MDV7263078.1 malto-oligosyltrehalose trehalohydrolase [Rhodococcus oxybenzonivorans]MDV7274617.1 malto-oligosyltrehalose trehalohydrolase [Rhodococcus oxybenzonivorans]MDV7335930.1 malto-oligosyltrehalose trehalohydrolase [Rhodococcus oxybenzonivorans]MDV7345567.1 malto-oligosyltrehalose trehalohydrolase [Rhodococcus oxybenzonivorans]